MKVTEKDDSYSDEEEYATTLESDEVAREIGKRSSKWKKQQPVMTVVIILAFGLRKLRAELRRRVEAWKHLSSLAYLDTNGTQTATIDQYEETSTIPCVSQSQNRSTFHFRFTRWANNNGKEIIRKLRWKIPQTK